MTDTLPLAKLTSEHLRRNVTIHYPTGDVEGVLTALTHGFTHTAARVSVHTPDGDRDRGTYQTQVVVDTDDGLTVTVGEPFVEPGATSTAKPERSRDYVTTINSPFD